MPFGQEDAARGFYGQVLGLAEEAKPSHLAQRGGVWFVRGRLKVHLGVEAAFKPAQKAHPAFLVNGIEQLRRRCVEAGFRVVDDEPLPGYERFYVYDPFGNRIECLEPTTK